MSSQDENHFVPQFYLRRFSSNKRQINLYNFRTKRIIVGASIKHQSSRHKFYDFNGELESALGELEGRTSSVLRRISGNRELPVRLSEDWWTLLVFIVFQRLRTKNAGRPNDVMTDYLVKLQLRDRSELAGIDIDSLAIVNKHAVALPLSVAADIVPAAADLEAHLLVNNSRVEFLTSDDPVVLHNQYCEGINYRGVIGWDCRGLQVLWPIDPRALLVLYDSGVYKIGGRRGGAVTEVVADADVRSLNALQILNAGDNVYFLGADGDAFVRDQCMALAPKRGGRLTISKSEEIPDGDGTSAILHTFQPLLPTKLTGSWIQVKRRARRTPIHERAPMYRKRNAASTHDRSDKGPIVRYPLKSTVTK